jgi:parallel beta-helix repeat protein
VGINGLTSGATNTAITNGTIIGSLAGVALSDGGIVRNVRVVSVTGSEATCGAIKCLDHCTITGNTADANTVCSPAGAITVGADALVTGNSVNDTTGGPGILAGSGAFISGNTVNSNSADGIEVVGAGALVAHNTASGNTIGLNFGANQGGYEDNVLTGNSSADTQGGTSLGGGNTNLCTAGVC